MCEIFFLIILAAVPMSTFPGELSVTSVEEVIGFVLVYIAIYVYKVMCGISPLHCKPSDFSVSKLFHTSANSNS